MRILVLTKNISYETKLQQELQVFNHEVLVTKNDLKDNLLTDNAILFHLLFISELISEKEFVEVQQQLTPMYKGGIVRILPEDELSASYEPTEVKNSKVEITCISRSFVNLREFLLNTAESNKLSAQLNSKEEFDEFLSKKEQILFRSLDEEQIISREELCWKIWGIKETASKKSQLSNLVKKINEKLDEHNYTSKRIKTYWGKGYLLK